MKRKKNLNTCVSSFKQSFGSSRLIIFLIRLIVYECEKLSDREKFYEIFIVIYFFRVHFFRVGIFLNKTVGFFTCTIVF